jgi:poly-gamma-glutamate capsule biosynthesis protein CapA/YwtB (metallophosphatase superfamily)
MPCRTPVTLFVCGDVMTGRGIDQILAHPNRPGIQEPYVRDAREYVALAEQANGPIHRPVEPAYIWGDVLQELERVRPDVRVINLETSVTSSDEFWPGKGIHYRMHPANIGCLTAARVDVCTLANNHVLDYGYAGALHTTFWIERSIWFTAIPRTTHGHSKSTETSWCSMAAVISSPIMKASAGTKNSGTISS